MPETISTITANEQMIKGMGVVRAILFLLAGPPISPPINQQRGWPRINAVGAVVTPIHFFHNCTRIYPVL